VGTLYSFEDVGGTGFINREAFERFVLGAVRWAERGRVGSRAGDKARIKAVIPECEARTVAGVLFDRLDEENRGEVECVELANRLYRANRLEPNTFEVKHAANVFVNKKGVSWAKSRLSSPRNEERPPAGRPRAPSKNAPHPNPNSNPNPNRCHEL